MIRRSFRIGLVLGVLAGLGLAVAKALQARKGDSADAPQREGAWPPLQQPDRAAATAAAVTTMDAPGTSPAPPRTPQPAPPPSPPVAPPRPTAPAPPPAPPPVTPAPPPVTPAPPPTAPTGRDTGGDSALDDDDILPAGEDAEEAAARRRTTGRKAAGKKATKRAPATKAATKKRAATKRAAKKTAAKKAADGDDRAWVEPSGDTCPGSHPIKAKLSSKIFHLPGMFAYDRTNPDRCYRDEESAESDGLRRAKR